MKLYNYFRSSAAYRARIALNLKGLTAENVFIHLQKNEQNAPAYLELNPTGLIPTLIDGDEVITQSLAIIEYLDEKHPQPPLLPSTAEERARVRSIALAIACDIHPLDNLRVLKYLTGVLKVSVEQKNEWYAHWVREGLRALEQRLAGDPLTGRFCHRDIPGLADVCLVPQLANARRVSLDLGPYPTLVRIDAACNALPAFAAAAPAKQPDALA
ncbi:MAG: maleylacetoacetate isomerase [Betaproteobacteria bacterium]